MTLGDRRTPAATPITLIAGALGLVLGCLAPAASAQLLEAPPEVYVPGGAVSTLRGPHGFDREEGAIRPSLHVSAISVSVELHPDLAFVSQTYTISNPMDGDAATIGIWQPDPSFGDGRFVRTTRPLGAVVWLAGERLPEDQVRIRPIDDEGARGYRVAITARFPRGESDLNLQLCVQTVASAESEGIIRPAGAGRSRIALQVSHYSWGWSPGEELERPPIVTRLSLAPPLGLDDLTADVWTDGAQTDGSALWWHGTPWVVASYHPPHTVSRAQTRDALLRRARALLDGPRRSHLRVPASLRVARRPGLSTDSPQSDALRARRALIVPASVLLLLLIAGTLYMQRRRRNK